MTRIIDILASDDFAFALTAALALLVVSEGASCGAAWRRRIGWLTNWSRSLGAHAVMEWEVVNA